MTDFLSTEDVLTLHADQVDLYGGGHGVRDMGLLQSAVAQPRASFEVDAPKGSIYDLTMSVATGKAAKAEVAEFFRSHAH